MPLPQRDEYYTYADYLTWDGSERWELIDGAPHAMAAPTWRHQRVVGNLYAQLRLFLKGRPCRAAVSPLDVRLNVHGGDDVVVQPDVLVVCDNSKIDEKGCKGAPDLVIEVTSPSSAGFDRVVKLNLYRRAGVKEYWMVDPENNSVQACVLKDGQYTVVGYEGGETVPVTVLPGCEIDLAEAFEE